MVQRQCDVKQWRLEAKCGIRSWSWRYIVSVWISCDPTLLFSMIWIFKTPCFHKSSMS